MSLNSTPFLSYREIRTDKTDLYEDAFGIYAQFSDVLGLLDSIKPVAGKNLTNRLVEKTRKIC